MTKQLLINEIKYHKILLIVEAVILLIAIFPFIFIDFSDHTLSIKIIFIAICNISMGIYSSNYRKEKLMERLIVMPVKPFETWAAKMIFQLVNWSVLFLIMALLLMFRGYTSDSLFETNSLLVINFLILARLFTTDIDVVEYKKISFSNYGRPLLAIISLIINAGTLVLYFSMLMGFNDPAKLLGNLLGINPAGYNMLLVSILLNITGIFCLYLSYRIFLSRRSFIQPKSAY